MSSASERCFDKMLFAAHITPLAWMSSYQNRQTRFFFHISCQELTLFHIRSILWCRQQHERYVTYIRAVLLMQSCHIFAPQVPQPACPVLLGLTVTPLVRSCSSRLDIHEAQPS
jgi:hypothetical protein